MFRAFNEKIPQIKQHKKKSKSQDDISLSLITQVDLVVFLSYDEQITIKIPFNCSLKIINSILTHKVLEFKKQQLIGFQSVPSNYSFDYRLRKNIGTLNQRKSLTLNCLYKSSSLNDLIKKEEESSASNYFLDQSSFYKLNKYNICKPLSSGGFSRVYLVRSLQNGEFYAAKFMEKSSQVNIDRAQAIKNQYFVHKSLSHPYIVKMEEYIETQEFYILIMEYCPGGQLFTLLKNNRYMGQEKAKMIFIQVLLAIKYLHDRNIVFRDIKPENILIDSKGNAKLTDFGLAKQIRDKTNSYCGSVQYMAPQIVSKQYYSLDVDLYCMGALLYQILIGCPPFYNPNFTNNQTKYHICNSQVCFPNKVVLSDEVRDLIESLLVKNPNQRLGHFQGVQQIFQHQWISDVCTQAFLCQQVECPFIPNLQIQNFDRQQDPYERQFRNKIFENIKQCKRLCTSLKVMNKFKFNSQIKNKSKSLAINSKKHCKSRSQEQFSSTTYSFKKHSSNFQKANLQQNSDQANPYRFSISKKTKSQFNSNHKLNLNNFKKKSLHHRTLSRSINKNIAVYEDSIKQEVQNILLIKSKSCGNSRKNSLYKKLQNKNQKQQTKAYQLNIQNSSQKKRLFSAKKNIYQKDRQFIPQKQYLRAQIKQKQQLNRPKTIKQKQNIEGKGLKRKNLLNKKKFMFSSMLKDSKLIKQNHFMFDKNNIYCQEGIQNRQTVV